MKLGLSLVGISHLVHKQRWPISRSYTTCKENYSNVLLPRLTKNFNVEVYLTTYESSEQKNIIDFYKPTKYQFLPFSNSHQIVTFIKSIEQLQGQNLDYVLITRFDINFNKGKIEQLKVVLDKINFLCKEKDHWDNYNFVNDCVYFLPSKYLAPLKQACFRLLEHPPRPGLMDMHGLYKFITQVVGPEQISFMTDEPLLSSGNEIYELKRLNID